MSKILFRFLLVPVLGLTFGARASTITSGVYELAGVTVNGYSLTGNLTLNSSGLVSAANLTFHDAAVNTPTFTTVASTGLGGFNPSSNFAYISGPTGQVVLDYLQTATSAGTISLCIVNTSCNGYQASYLQIYSPLGFNGFGTAYLSGGTLNPVQSSASPTMTATGVTPEPSSLALLGTGALAAAIVGSRLAARERVYPASEVSEA